VITQTRRSSRFCRPQDRLEAPRVDTLSIAPTETFAEFVGVCIPRRLQSLWVSAFLCGCLHFSAFPDRRVRGCLDFCVPCMATVPYEKALVEKFRARPLVLVGVNGDDNRELVKTDSAKEGITWRSFWNGGPRQGIPVQWSIRGWGRST
jgi:thiol-disulfide isomerase/thioredoxin